MPYIKGADRRSSLHYGSAADAKNVGELTFIFYDQCLNYLWAKGESYQTHADIRAALYNSADEWYRRKIAPYEDKKILENGDLDLEE